MIGIVIAFFTGLIVAAAVNAAIDRANRLARYKEDQERNAYNRVSRLCDRVDSLEESVRDHATVFAAHSGRLQALERSVGACAETARACEKMILDLDTGKENRNGRK